MLLSELLELRAYGHAYCEQNRKFRLISCVLRNDGAGWYAIDDSTHAPINVDSVTNDTVSINLLLKFTESSNKCNFF